MGIGAQLRRHATPPSLYLPPGTAGSRDFRGSLAEAVHPCLCYSLKPKPYPKLPQPTFWQVLILTPKIEFTGTLQKGLTAPKALKLHACMTVTLEVSNF